ncbi:hypothetical protein SKAU_G00114260 [Synaphobranchus kaupii]|uniref:Uncharacterized protein n=1 Tax=Synaphobranchus kaupii TaxID=118154 RepID=A0A9Q1G1U9_SYNKA|nr:hypothetical protein SKAU_G00114260 [Synaphobranchus kaupii]
MTGPGVSLSAGGPRGGGLRSQRAVVGRSFHCVRSVWNHKEPPAWVPAACRTYLHACASPGGGVGCVLRGVTEEQRIQEPALLGLVPLRLRDPLSQAPSSDARPVCPSVASAPSGVAPYLDLLSSGLSEAAVSCRAPPPPTRRLAGPLSPPRRSGKRVRLFGPAVRGDSCCHMRCGRQPRVSFRTHGPTGLAPEQKASVTSSVGWGSTQVPVPGVCRRMDWPERAAVRSCPLVPCCSRLSERGAGCRAVSFLPPSFPIPQGTVCPPWHRHGNCTVEAQASVLFITV